jgi:ribulose 1,5-bisphosphate synthetase/thiazole synthase
MPKDLARDAEVDVLVIGAGESGLIAALAAAKKEWEL